MAKVSISRAWDESRVVLARDGKLIASVALALLVLPGVVVNVLLPQAAGLGTAAAVVGTIVVLVAFLITFAGQLSVVRLATGPHITVGEAIRHSIARVLPFIGAFLLWAVPIVLLASVPYRMVRADPAHPPFAASLALLVVGLLGVFLAVRLMLIGPVASAEPVGPPTIIKRSWHLTSGNWWRLFGFLLVFALAAIAVVLAVKYAIGVLAGLALGDVSRNGVAALIVFLVLQTVTVAIYAVLFVMQARIYVQLAGREHA